jgi:hypothetical protein
VYPQERIEEIVRDLVNRSLDNEVTIDEKK